MLFTRFVKFYLRDQNFSHWKEKKSINISPIVQLSGFQSQIKFKKIGLWDLPLIIMGISEIQSNKAQKSALAKVKIL